MQLRKLVLRVLWTITLAWVALVALMLWVAWEGVCSVLRGSWMCPWGLGQ